MEDFMFLAEMQWRHQFHGAVTRFFLILLLLYPRLLVTMIILPTTLLYVPQIHETSSILRKVHIFFANCGNSKFYQCSSLGLSYTWVINPTRPDDPIYPNGQIIE